MKDANPDPGPDARLDARLRAEFTPPADVAERARRAAAAAGAPKHVKQRPTPLSGLRRSPVTRVAAGALLLLGFGLAFDAWLGKRAEPTRAVNPAGMEEIGSPIDWRRTYGDLTAALARTPMPILSCDASTDLGPYLKDGICSDPSVRFAAGRVIQGPLECSAVPEASVLGIPGLDGKPPVFVIVTPLAPEPLPIAKDLGGLHLHRRVVGGLDLYELTPLEEPSCLDLFEIQGGEAPPPSCSWTQVQ
jgi:hypothetical protein